RPSIATVAKVLQGQSAVQYLGDDPELVQQAQRATEAAAVRKRQDDAETEAKKRRDEEDAAAKKRRHDADAAAGSVKPMTQPQPPEDNANSTKQSENDKTTRSVAHLKNKERSQSHENDDESDEGERRLWRHNDCVPI
ncbi:hypothetical protein HKX48_008312, partial [Thoreauomyces humboldtii]